MTGILIIAVLILVWALAIRVITVRRMRAEREGDEVSAVRPTMHDYEKSLKWSSEVLEPHLMFLAVIMLGIFTYRISANQNKMIERQVELDESRQPVTFTFSRNDSFDHENYVDTETIAVSASKGYVANLRFWLRQYMDVSLLTEIGEQTYRSDRVIRIRMHHYFDIEVMGIEHSPNMTWTAEDRYQQLLNVINDARSYFSERYDQEHTSYVRFLEISPSFVSFDYDHHTDYYMMRMHEDGGSYSNELSFSYQINDQLWGPDDDIPSISFLSENWIDTAAELRSIIDEQMRLPGATPEIPQ